MIEVALRLLIIEKYGADKFLLGCETVAQWLNFETHSSYASGFIIEICNQETPVKMLTEDEDYALRRLLIRSDSP